MSIITLPGKRGENRKAGLSVATINIPLSISLALASGLDPLTGLLTGIRGCGLAALTTSSKYNVFGIAGALSGVILLFVREFGAERIPLLTMMSGILILLIRFLGIVKYITLIPSSALHGFVIGVGMIIISNQLPDLTGIDNFKSEGIISLIVGIFTNINNRDIPTISIGGFFLLFLLIWKKYVPQFPGVLIATVIGGILGLISNHIGLDNLALLQDRYPELIFSLIAFPYALLTKTGIDWLPLLAGILKTSSVIAIIAIVETIVSAKIAAKMTKEAFSKEKEVQGLGITNFIGGFLGIAPSTAVFVRTALNIKSGATERSAALITAFTTAIISVFLFKNFFLYIPLSVIAAILISIAISMINIRLIQETSKIDKTQGVLIILVALITFFEDPIFGILTGVGISLLLQIAEKTKPHLQCTCFHKGNFIKKGNLQEYCDSQCEDHVLVIKLPSEITYLNSDIMFEEAKRITSPIKIIFSCSQLYSIDIDGLEILDELIDQLHEHGCMIHLTGITEIAGQLAHLKWFPILEAEGCIWESTSQCLQKIK